MGDWTVFSNHGHVLVCLANNKEARLRDVAADVGITERAVQKIVHELQRGGFIGISKHGRCNRYDVNTRKNLRHPLQSHCTVGVLLMALAGGKASRKKSAGELAQPEVAAQKRADSMEAPNKSKLRSMGHGRPESAAAPGTGPKVEMGAEPKTRAKSAHKPEGGPDAAEKASGKRRKKIDTRQQGSLF